MQFNQITVADETIRQFCEQYGIQSLSLFGSILHGGNHDDSDLDLLVTFVDGVQVSLFDMGRMQMELTELFGMTVDLKTANDLSRHFRQQVLSEAKPIYLHVR